MERPLTTDRSSKKIRSLIRSTTAPVTLREPNSFMTNRSLVGAKNIGDYQAKLQQISTSRRSGCVHEGKAMKGGEIKEFGGVPLICDSTDWTVRELYFDEELEYEAAKVGDLLRENTL